MAEVNVYYIVDAAGAYLAAYPAPEEPQLAEGYALASSAPTRADQRWNGERWVYPLRDYAAGDGTYAGEFEEGTAPEGCTVASSAPQDAADQRWDGRTWQWPTHFYVNSDGTYWGGYAGPDKPVGLTEVATAPADARAIWDGEAWGAVSD